MYGTLYFTDDQLMLKKIGTKLVQNWYKNLYELVQKIGTKNVQKFGCHTISSLKIAIFFYIN